MKRIILLAGITFFLCSVQAQEVSRGQLMDLFYKAQKAEQTGNRQEALEIYKTILSVDANFSIPYLKMANIYAVDQSNKASIAAAATLYKKYLSLQPDDENAAAITKKIADLQQRTSNEADLNQLLYIGKEDAKQVFEAKARRGIASNKEELEQQIEKANTLYDQAQEAISNNNTEASVQYTEQLSEQTDPSNPLTAQTSMMMAEMYGKQGNLQKMQNELTTLADNLEMYKQMQQYYTTTIKDALPFEDDICGVWISDLAYNDAPYHTDSKSLPASILASSAFAKASNPTNNSVTPFLIIEIQKDGKSSFGYNATILPYCKVAEDYKIYTGKPFQYTPKYNAKFQSSLALSSIDSIHLDNNSAFFHFGDKKFSGTSTEVDNLIIKPAMSVVSETAKSVISNTGNVYIQAAAEIGNLLVQLGLFKATEKKNTETGLDLNMRRLFAGCTEVDLVHNTYITKTSGYEKQSSDTIQLRLYKLYPDDSILFTANGNELFGYKTFTKDEILRMDEYEHLQALKDKSYFNKQAYKKLADKISVYCYTKANDNPEFQRFASDSRKRFEFATRGLSYRTFINKYGSFEGWVDVSGKMNGLGKSTLNDGTTYIGNWENNKYSGKGTITLHDKKTHEVTQEYTGTFYNNSYNGKGLLKFGTISYEGDFVNGVFEGAGKLADASGNIYDGAWKSDKPLKGTITYLNGDRYEGPCLFNQKTQQIERDGTGTMVYANGQKASGKWENDKLISIK